MSLIENKIFFSNSEMECAKYELRTPDAKRQGATSRIYEIPNVGILKNLRPALAYFGVMAREVCVLQRLQQFDWSPKLVCVGSDYFVSKF